MVLLYGIAWVASGVAALWAAFGALTVQAVIATVVQLTLALILAAEMAVYRCDCARCS